MGSGKNNRVTIFCWNRPRDFKFGRGPLLLYAVFKSRAIFTGVQFVLQPKLLLKQLQNYPKFRIL